MRLKLFLQRLPFLTIMFCWAAHGQQSGSPGTSTIERQYRERMSKRPQLQAHATQIFDAEMAGDKKEECPGAMTTYDINVCLEKEVGTTGRNLKEYEITIRELLSLFSQEPAAPGIGTSSDSAKEFDDVEQTWQRYRDVACKAARDEMDGGTAAPASEMECDLRLARSHMRELDSIYFMELHK